MNKYLSKEKIDSLLSTIEGESVPVDRVRPHNKGEIRRTITMSVDELKDIIFDSIDEEHIPGGDIEVKLPKLNQLLVGQHDGIYWLEQAT